MAIESFLTYLSWPFFAHSLEPFTLDRERGLGADARLTSGVKSFLPLYMQFKRPSSYLSTSTSGIVSDRRAVAPGPLSVDPQSLFFKLRAKKPRHHDYQHNILHKLSRRLRSKGLGDAAYVCPLFLDGTTYRREMHRAAWWKYFCPPFSSPYGMRGLQVHGPGGTINLAAVPLLKNHIAIRPHALVTTHNHCYSFNELGSEVCFHSPLVVAEGVMNCGEWIGSQWNYFIKRGESGQLTASTAMSALEDLVRNADGDEGIEVPSRVFETRDGIEAWLRFSEFLSDEYGICAYAFVEW
jgi:hypothetical protein